MSSRLRTSNGRHGTLQDIEDTINSTGKRRIAKFEMSIADPDVLVKESSKAIAKAEKAGSAASRHESDSEVQLSSFDVDVFSKDYRLASRKVDKNEHVFARAEACRGAWNLSDDAVRDPRDRFGDGPGVQRYVTSFRLVRVSRSHGLDNHAINCHLAACQPNLDSLSAYTASYRKIYGTNNFQVHRTFAISGT
jgi:hypothetical protein